MDNILKIIIISYTQCSPQRKKKKVGSDSGCTAMGGAPQCVGTPAYLVPESGPPI